VVYIIQICWQLASRSKCSCLQAASKLLWHIQLLCVQWKTCDDGQRNCPKYVDFHSKNKIEKSVHLVGFIIRNLTRCTVTWMLNCALTLVDFQLHAQNYLFTFNTFIKILYMFRALPCSSSGGLRRNFIYMQPLVSSLSAGDCPVHRLRKKWLEINQSYTTMHGHPIIKSNFLFSIPLIVFGRARTHRINKI